jgi:hypothetical protein
MDKGILLGTKTLVLIIRHYIRELSQRLDTIKMWHSTYFPNVCVSVIFTYCQNGGETDGVEFDTYWQNGGYKKISDIIFAECHIFLYGVYPIIRAIFNFFKTARWTVKAT